MSQRHFNHCQLGRKDVEQEQRELYAHGLRYRLQKGLITQFDAKIELNKRQDKQRILEILKRIKENVQDNSNNS